MGDFMPYRSCVTLESTDCDAAGRLNCANMARILQGAAAEHAKELGVGMTALERLGALWVVTRMSVIAERLPVLGERVRVETWPGKTRHVLFPRYYEMKSEDGVSLLKGSGVWMLIHPESRKMLFPEEIGLTVPDLSQGGEMPLPDRRVRFPEELGVSRRRRVQAHELDSNRHLNNAHYLGWGEALLPDGFAAEHQLKKLWVEYRKELRFDQEAELHSALEDDVLYVVGTVGEEEHYRMRLDYEKL